MHQATIKEEVYAELPQGYKLTHGNDVVLKLQKSLYGLVQAPLSWYNHLSKGLHDCGFEQSKNDPCLFYGNGVMVLAYVDNCIFFSKDSNKIDAVIEKLCKTFDLMVDDIQEDAQVNVFSYLGVQVTIDKAGVVTFLQPSLIKKVHKYCRMSNCNKNGLQLELNHSGLMQMVHFQMLHGNTLQPLGCYCIYPRTVDQIYNMPSTNVLDLCTTLA